MDQESDSLACAGTWHAGIVVWSVPPPPHCGTHCRLNKSCVGVLGWVGLIEDASMVTLMLLSLVHGCTIQIMCPVNNTIECILTLLDTECIHVYRLFSSRLQEGLFTRNNNRLAFKVTACQCMQQHPCSMSVHAASMGARIKNAVHVE